jgi:HSP20 family protein
MKLLRRGRQDRGAMAPTSDLNRIRTELDRFIEDPFSLVRQGRSFFEGWEPSVDVYEDKDKTTIRAELPGMKKDDIQIALNGDTITISGERKQEEEHGDGQNYRSERFFGRFMRTITLSHAVDPRNIDASYKDGVLTITLPKSEESKPKQIPIQGS